MPIKSSNIERALRAKRTLRFYGSDNNTKEDLRTTLCDLIADIRHVCDAEGIDWDSVLYTAIEVYYRPEAEEYE